MQSSSLLRVVVGLDWTSAERKTCFHFTDSLENARRGGKQNCLLFELTDLKQGRSDQLTDGAGRRAHLP
jgi:hypothetical protein